MDVVVEMDNTGCTDSLALMDLSSDLNDSLEDKVEQSASWHGAQWTRVLAQIWHRF